MSQTAIFQVFNFASLAKKAFRRSIGVRIREEAEIIEGEAFFLWISKGAPFERTGSAGIWKIFSTNKIQDPRLSQQGLENVIFSNIIESLMQFLPFFLHLDGSSSKRCYKNNLSF